MIGLDTQTEEKGLKPARVGSWACHLSASFDPKQAHRYAPRTMKKMFFTGFLSLGILLLASWVAIRFNPGLALKPLYGWYQFRSGLSLRHLTTAAGESFSFYEGGSGPPVILIHGFGDSKASFVQMVKGWSPHHRLILPDVPGFGETAMDPKLDYSIESQANRMIRLAGALGIENADWVGNSMGGHIAAVVALDAPKLVRKLVVLSPAGLLVDDPIPYREVEHPLRDDADFEAYMSQVFFKKPWIPGPFQQEFIRKSQERFTWQNRIRSDIRSGGGYLLNDRLSQIHAPTLIVWGRHDGVIRVTHAPVWKEKIRSAILEVLEDAGHSPQYEMPERASSLVLGFLDR